LARGIQGLRRQSRDLRAEVDFLDRFSTSLPAAACAAARSYLAIIEHAAEMTLAQVEVLRAEIAKQRRLMGEMGAPQMRPDRRDRRELMRLKQSNPEADEF